jgi:hypothetical protein
MRRRRLLAVAGLSVGGIAGCLSDNSSDNGENGDEESNADEPTRSPDRVQTDATVGGAELPISGARLERRLPRDAIAAIVNPVFARDWSGLDPDGVEDPTLSPGTAVVGVERAGETRAYPMRILNRHEIVNDAFDVPVAVTYCPLCGSSVVLDRRVDGEGTVFGVSGLLWRDHLVMYDEATESRWSQLFATAIQGPKTGTRLDRVSATLTTWGEWQQVHPETTVLLPPPRSKTINGTDGGASYFEARYTYDEEDQLIGYDSQGGADLKPWTLVVGIQTDGEVRAYPFFEVAESGVVNDSIGELPVVVGVAPGGTLVAYDRRVAGEPLRFESGDDRHLIAGGSRFERTTGLAVDGPFEGTHLDRANERPPMFWRGWSNIFSETDVYDG